MFPLWFSSLSLFFFFFLFFYHTWILFFALLPGIKLELVPGSGQWPDLCTLQAVPRDALG